MLHAVANPMRLVLVDDHEMVLQGLTAMLAHFSAEVVIVGTATSHETGLERVKDANPDIVLCDVRLAGASGIDLCRAITAAHPAVKVVLLTVYDDEHYVFQALRVGACGYILKRVDAGE